MTGLTQLVYVSRREEGVSTDDVVDHIVLPAMRKNRRLDVTGCLWFGPKRFVQVLEGAPETIDALYKSIAADHRHDNVTLLNVSPISDRDFARFALKHIQGDEIAEVNRLIERYAPADARGPVVRRRPEDPLSGEDATIIEALVTRLRALVN